MKAEWKRNRAHTLVAHHQVRQTLKGNKSKVSKVQGSMGRCCHSDKKMVCDKQRVFLYSICITKGKKNASLIPTLVDRPRDEMYNSNTM